MAGSNSPFGRSSGISSLIRGADSTAASIADFHDSMASYEYENSAHTDDAFQKYQTYLQDRIGTLGKSTTISSQQKALTLTRTLESAYHSNVSSGIQRENIQIMAGNATPQDKLNLLGEQFQKAVSIGDYTLAQSLESQAYSLSQTIQQQETQQAQQSADDAIRTNNANQLAQKQGYGDAINHINNALTTVSEAYKHGGEEQIKQALQDFTKSMGPTFDELGIKLPKGTQLNMGGLAEAAFNAKLVYNKSAASAFGVQFDETGNPVPGTGDENGYGQKFAQDYINILNGSDTINVGGQKLTAQDAVAYANSPSLYTGGTDISGNNALTKGMVTGYHYVNGVLLPYNDRSQEQLLSTVDAKGAPLAKKDMEKQLNALGFTVVKDNGSSIQVKFTKQTDAWTQHGGSKSNFSEGETVTLIPQANGGFVFSKDNSLHTIAFDNKGLGGLFSLGSDGKLSSIAGQYGFNHNLNTMVSNATVMQLQQKAAEAQRVAESQAAAAKQQASSQQLMMPNSPNPTQLASGAQPPSYAGTNANTGGPMMSQRAGGGFNFSNNGQAISAARYAQLTNTAFRNVLSNMAAKGDTGAQSALGFVGNDFGYDPTKIGTNSTLYNSLVWGTGKQYTGAAAGPNVVGGKLTLPSGFKF